VGLLSAGQQRAGSAEQGYRKGEEVIGMQSEWLIEEELIEWLDRFGGESEWGREIRLINPKGEIVGRRLAVGAITEHYLFFRGNTAYTWFYPFKTPTVFTAQIPDALLRLWMSRSLMPYFRDDFGNLYGSVQWQLLERDTASNLKFCTHRQCSRRLIERYRYLPRVGESATVEWRVCFRAEPPLLGQEVPVCSELWWEGRLRRRHILLHYRTAIPEEHAFFRIPRHAKIHRVEVANLFSPIHAYAPPLLSD